MEAVFVRSNLVTADGLYGRPTTINQPSTGNLGDSGGGGACHLHGNRLWKQPYKGQRELAPNKEKKKSPAGQAGPIQLTVPELPTSRSVVVGMPLTSDLCC